jgi:hypothetical protein
MMISLKLAAEATYSLAVLLHALMGLFGSPAAE